MDGTARSFSVSSAERNRKELLGRALAETTYHHFPGGRKKLEVLIEIVVRLSPEHRRILDVGCGNGALSFPLAAIGCQVVGTDVDAESIETCRSRRRFPNARFVQSGGLLREVDGPFDLIVCAELLEHLHDPRPLVAAMAERLAPEGRLFVTVPNGYGLREIGGRLEKRLRRRPSFERSIISLRRRLVRFGMPSERDKYVMHTSNPEQEHVQKFTRGSILRLLHGAGFEVVDWRKSFLTLSVFHCRSGLSWIERIDSRAADLLPAAMASGWYITCRKVRESRSP